MRSSWRALALLFSAAVLRPRSQANMLDLVQPLKLRPSECSFGCARWADLAADGSTANQTAVDESWAAGSAPPGADNLCAQQGRSLRATVGENYTDGWNNSSPWTPDMAMPGAFGAFCYCKGYEERGVRVRDSRQLQWRGSTTLRSPSRRWVCSGSAATPVAGCDGAATR